MKKILLLGGSIQQIPAIEYAKKQGYYTILCDYLYDNPGQYVADKFYCASTTDKELILSIAKENNIDGIVAYASDPAAATAAYIGEKLGLPSNPYDSVLILSKKDLFRKFLKENGFNCPKAESFKNIEDAVVGAKLFKFPIIIKPIDSSGSKGVTRVNCESELKLAIEVAFQHSRDKVIIIEEFIERSHPYMIGGDAFVIDGKLIFKGYLNSHRNTSLNPYVPIGTSFPTFLSEEQQQLVQEQVQKVIDLLNIKIGALNLELMFDKEGKLYIIEIGPRNGGNMIPDLLQLATGVNLIAATVEAALGNNEWSYIPQEEKVFYSTYVLHSSKNGKLKEIIYQDEIKDNVINKILYTNIGDNVEIFNGANKALGIVFLKYQDIEEMKYKMENMHEFIKIDVI